MNYSVFYNLLKYFMFDYYYGSYKLKSYSTVSQKAHQDYHNSFRIISYWINFSFV